MVALIEARHDDMAALDQPDPAIAPRPMGTADDVGDPGARRIHQCAGADGARPARRLDRRDPAIALALCIDQPRARRDRRAPLRRVDRVEHDEAAVLDPAVRINESLALSRRKPVAQRRTLQRDRARARQLLATAQMVIEEQAQPHHPGGPRRLGLGQDEGQRPDDVRRHVQQPLALDQRLSHQPELAIFQIAQTAMDQLGRG